MLNGDGTSTRCSLPPFNTGKGFTYSIGNKYKYSCPMGTSTIVKNVVSDLLSNVVSIIMFYIVIYKKMSTLCIIVRSRPAHNTLTHR